MDHSSFTSALSVGCSALLRRRDEAKGGLVMLYKYVSICAFPHSDALKSIAFIKKKKSCAPFDAEIRASFVLLLKLCLYEMWVLPSIFTLN